MNQTVINHVLPSLIPNDIAAPLKKTFGKDRVKVLSIFEDLGGADLTR